MKPAVGRLALTAVLFVAWLGYLAYLKRQTPPIHHVPSRPQLLVADLVVLARVDGLELPIRVVQVLSPEDDPAQKLVGDGIVVENLASCRHVESKDGKFVTASDYFGPGEYVLPLTRDGDRFRITATPPSPGYPTDGPPRPGPPRFYPATTRVLADCRRTLR